jgi:hypothetical protein
LGAAPLITITDVATYTNPRILNDIALSHS